MRIFSGVGIDVNRIAGLLGKWCLSRHRLVFDGRGGSSAQFLVVVQKKSNGVQGRLLETKISMAEGNFKS